MVLFKETPKDNFNNLPNFNYDTKYIYNLLNLTDDYSKFKVAYIDENINGKSGTILCIHGHPTWSYIWRHLIPIAIECDFRILAIDLPGFGRSDKPLNKDFFLFSNFRNLLLNFIERLELKDIYLFMHEWGGTLGLTLPMENINLYSGVICFNSFLGNKSIKVSENYLNWIDNNTNNEDLNVRALMARTNRILNLLECNAYEAPFPDKSFKLALKMLPKIFPLDNKNDGFDIIEEAEKWWTSNKLMKSFVIGGGRDPLMPLEKMKLLSKLISTDDFTHVIDNAGHFTPEWGMEFGHELLKQIKE